MPIKSIPVIVNEYNEEKDTCIVFDSLSAACQYLGITTQAGSHLLAASKKGYTIAPLNYDYDPNEETII